MELSYDVKIITQTQRYLYTGNDTKRVKYITNSIEFYEQSKRISSVMVCCTNENNSSIMHVMATNFLQTA